MSTLKEAFNIRELAYRYYQRAKPEKNYARAQAQRQWLQDKKRDMKIVKKIVSEMWKEIKQELETTTL